MIQDSGKRREFETGAVRDIQEGKGRCDLLPLEEVAAYLDEETFPYGITVDPITCLKEYKKDRNDLFIFMGLDYMAHEQDVSREELVLEVAKHMEEGAKKYGERNWEKGIPTHCYMDSAIRHFLKWKIGMDDEDHWRATCWNLLCLAHTANYIREVDDL